MEDRFCLCSDSPTHHNHHHCISNHRQDSQIGVFSYLPARLHFPSLQPALEPKMFQREQAGSETGLMGNLPQKNLQESDWLPLNTVTQDCSDSRRGRQAADAVEGILVPILSLCALPSLSPPAHQAMGSELPIVLPAPPTTL